MAVLAPLYKLGNSLAVGGTAQSTFAANVSITGYSFATNFSGAGAAITALNASNLSSGSVPVGQLGLSGTANTTTFLRGDNTWATPAGGGGGGLTWSTITSGNVATAATNNGYVMETGGTLRTVTLPASCAAGFNIVVNANAGQVRIVSNGNTIDGVGGGNDLLLDNGNTASLVAKATGSLEVIFGGTSAGTLPSGGATGLVLMKTSSADYDYTWTTPVVDGDKGEITVTSGVWALDTIQPTVHTWSLAQTFTVAPVFTDQSGTRTALGLGTMATATAANYALLASPTFSGTPSLPSGTFGATQAANDSTTLIATTAFVTTANNLKANLASPTFTGAPTLPTGAIAVTQAQGDNTTAVATTAFVKVARDPQVQTLTSSATPTPTFLNDQLDITAQAVAITTFTNPTGTAIHGRRLLVRIKDNGSSQTISWGTVYAPMGQSLPTSTPAGKWMVLGFIYDNTRSKFDLIAKSVEA